MKSLRRYRWVLLAVLATLPVVAADRPCDTAADCLSGWVCEFPIGDCARANGICRLAPTCDTNSGLVCGCDGDNYASECDAFAAGVVIESLGACQIGNSCGGQTCTGNNFCQLPVGACKTLLPESCPYGVAGPRAYEVAGWCVPWPDSCPPDGDPVCGCNGQTYPNACFAARTFNSIRKEEPCENGDCGGFFGAVCSGTDVCLSCLTCGGFDVPGSCYSEPVSCADHCAPVCSCSGQWYKNHCEWVAGEQASQSVPIGLGELAGCGEATGVAFYTDDEMYWVYSSSPNPIEYNVYRASLIPSAQPGPWACLSPGLQQANYQAVGTPATGEIWAYVVTRVESGVEGPLGWGGAGCTERLNTAPCPP